MDRSGVAVVGDNCIDVYVDPPGRSAVGGNALNVAVNLGLLGIGCRYFSVVGDDAGAERVRGALDCAGVDCRGLRVCHGRTWVAYIRVQPGGIAVVEREEFGVGGPYSPTREDLNALEGYEHVHLANLAEPANVLTTLARAGISTSYDFGSVADGGYPTPTDVAFFSSVEADEDRAAAIARRAFDCGARLAVVTMGAAGSLAFDGEHVFLVPAEPIDPVDTLGAGDSYIATFLSGCLTGISLEVAMNAASRAASRTCLHRASWPQDLLLVHDRELQA